MPPAEIFLHLSPDERWVLGKLASEIGLTTVEDTISFAVWAAATSWKIKVPPRAFAVRGASDAPPSKIVEDVPPSICGCGYEGTSAEVVIHVLVGTCHDALELQARLEADHGLRARIEPVGDGQ